MKLIIVDVFYFSDGRTVFVFLDEDRLPGFIMKGWFTLLIDGKYVEKILIDGEDLVKYTDQNKKHLRSISTRQSSVYKAFNFEQNKWILESVLEKVK